MRVNHVQRRSARCRIAVFHADVCMVAGHDAKFIERPIVYLSVDAYSGLVVSAHVARQKTRMSVEADLRRIYGQTPIQFH